MNHQHPADPNDAAAFDCPTGGRRGPRGGRHLGQERADERAAYGNEPGIGWDDVIRAIEDDATPID